MFKKVVAFSSFVISKIHVPFAHKKTTELDCLQAIRLMKDGDIILTHTDGELSNVVLSHWGHGAVVSKEKIYESVTAGFKKTDPMFFFSRKDQFIILRPQFTIHEPSLNSWLEYCLGTLYDYGFETGAKKLYCFEACADAMHAANTTHKINMVKTPLGKQYLGKSFTDDPRFAVIFESKI